MKHLCALLAAATLGSAALADSYSVGVSGGFGQNATSQISFSGFDGTLGALQQVIFDISATTTFDITISSNPGVPPSGTATYSLQNSSALYIDSVGGNPYVEETGTGTVPLSFGVFTASTSGMHGMTTITDNLTPFYTSSLTGYVLADNPFNYSIQANGSNTGISNVAITGKSLNASVTYVYLSRTGVVPEPATWAMLICGFGLVGSALRQRRSVAAAA